MSEKNWDRKELSQLIHNREIVLALFDGWSEEKGERERMAIRHEAEKLNLVEELTKLKGKKDHPEHYCHRCNGRNISWHTDNDMWNDLGDGIVCPICLDELHYEKYGNSPHWKITVG